MNPRVAVLASKVGFDVAQYTWFDATINKETEDEIYAWGKKFLPNWNVPLSLHEYLAPFSKMAFFRKELDYVFTYEKDAPSLCIWSANKKQYPIVEIEPSEVDNSVSAKSVPEILTGKTEQENFEIEDKFVVMAQSLLHLVCLINMRAHRLESILEGYQAKDNKFINERRRKKNKSLVFSWNTIELKPSIEIKHNRITGTHASPARHKRRGHLRKKRDGSFTWILEMWVGQIENGFIVHDYVAGKELTKGK